MGLVTDLAGQSVYLDANILIYALEGHARLRAGAGLRTDVE